MTPELKAKWLAALRSGEYVQGTGHFEKDRKFCCLGVLCKVAGEPTGTVEYSNWAFVHSVVPDPIVSDAYHRNDGSQGRGIKAQTFAQIADWLEGAI